jgi:hypothetical protein
VYEGDFRSSLLGTASAPIVVRQYSRERATIDGSLTIDGGGFAWFWGFEVMFSDARRVSTEEGSWPRDLPRAGKSVDMRASGIKLINMVIHDIGGIGAWEPAVNSEIYGSLIYNNGWEAPDRAHGHGLYIQNAAGTKRIVDNIIFSNFSFGIQVYAASAGLNGIVLERNVVFNNGMVAEGGGSDLTVASAARGLTVSNNHFYRSDRGLTAVVGGPWANNAGDARFTGNHFVGSVQLTNWSHLEFRANQLVGGNDYLVLVRPVGGQSKDNFQLTGQNYHRQPNSNLPFFLYGTGYLTLGGWQQRGLDVGSDIADGDPGEVQVDVLPNAYEAGRATVVVYDWGSSSGTDVDLSPVLEPGWGFEVRHAQDFFGPPVVSGTYEGGTITIPHAVRQPEQPVGGSSRPAPSTGPEFNVYVVVPDGTFRAAEGGE